MACDSVHRNNLNIRRLSHAIINITITSDGYWYYHWSQVYTCLIIAFIILNSLIGSLSSLHTTK
jgi:hypothetical protein